MLHPANGPYYSSWLRLQEAPAIVFRVLSDELPCKVTLGEHFSSSVQEAVSRGSQKMRVTSEKYQLYSAFWGKSLKHHED